MRAAFALILLTMAAFAQDPSAIASAEAACGPKGVNFDVKDDNSQHNIGQPEAGKALVYVIQDIGAVNCIGGCITTKIAVDGGWVGVNHHNSYLFFAIDPGEHHLCANWQSRVARMSRVIGLAHFTAEASKVYYFRTRLLGVGGPTFFDIDSIDSDMGRFFVASIPLSSWSGVRPGSARKAGSQTRAKARSVDARWPSHS
jgi:hypothetical protein